MTRPPKPDVDPPADAGAATAGKQPPEPDELQRFRKLVETANKGDPAAIAALRQYLDEHPHIWQHVGDLAKVARQAWIALVAGNDLLARESLQRRLDQLRADLIGDDPGPIDRLLAEQVLATWLEANHLQMVVADTKGGNATTNPSDTEATLSESSRRRDSPGRVIRCTASRRTGRPGGTRSRAPIGNIAGSNRGGRSSILRRGWRSRRRRVVAAVGWTGFAGPACTGSTAKGRGS